MHKKNVYIITGLFLFFFPVTNHCIRKKFANCGKVSHNINLAAFMGEFQIKIF